VLDGGLKSKFVGAGLFVCVLYAENSAAFLHHLEGTQVREAHFLGSNHGQKAAALLGRYVRDDPEPDKGPWVYRIQLRTPYEEVVRRAWESGIGYSAQRAREEYHAQGDIVAVRVLISFVPPRGSTLSPTGKDGRPVGQSKDLQREFPVHVTQTRLIEPRVVAATPQYSKYRTGISGVEILLEFAAEQFESSVTHVQVITPEGQTVSADFDLDKLE